MNKSTPKIYRTTNWSSYNRALLIVEILPFGLILLRNGMPHQKANKDEIKLTPTQLSNAA
ncbi:iS5 family transposase [Acinetobacter baumannii 25935_8]|nr:iS5 family transposase [Acinetobacter baumannii 647609]EXH33595.1 iS5 family transposase [Acinetobacter baumannii 1264936]EXV44447.1 iS5 family transposase [Acinetobacter baumannii 25935_8]EYS02671.1 iS5 family transposase [Acinetobacter baumannii 25569_6]EYS03278.1 iS5 family transposase [Acinetobacter baumannii 25569_6]